MLVLKQNFKKLRGRSSIEHYYCEFLFYYRQEVEKSVKEAQAKLAELESQILRKVMSTPSPTQDSKNDVSAPFICK